MIRDAVLHMNNEQPLMADLFELPEGNTALLRCTNLRMLNGKRPIFADDVTSVFFFPMLHLRFIEVLPKSLGGEHLALGPGPDAPIEMGSGGTEAVEEDFEVDEDFLRRVREA
jgi:hypothetical protein